MTLPPFFRALGSTIASRAGLGLMNYGLFWTLSQLLGHTELGGFSLLTNVFFAVQALPMLGLISPFVRRVATQRDQLATEITNACVFALPVSLVLALAIGIWGQHHDGGVLAVPFWLVAAALLPAAWNCAAEGALIGQERFIDLARINLAEATLRTLLALACVRLGFGLTGVFAVFLLLRVVVAAVYLMHPALPLPRLRLASGALQRRNWHELPVFFAIAITVTLLLRLDVVVLAYLRNLGEVGIYAAASRLYEAAQMVPTVLALVVLPVLSRQFANSREQFGNTLGVAVRLTLTLGLAAALPAFALAQTLVDLLYKPELAGAGLALRWLAFAAVLMVTDVILSSTMIAAHAQMKDLQALAINLAVLVCGLLALVPHLGAQGAAMAVVLGICTRLWLRLRWTVATLGLPPLGADLTRLAGATVLGLASLRACEAHGPVVAACAALAAYLAAVVLTGGLGRHPLSRLRTDLALLLQRKIA